MSEPSAQLPSSQIPQRFGLIEWTPFLRIEPGPAQMAWFGLSEAKPLYGRLAIIHCDGEAAVELLEVVAPEYTSPELPASIQ